MAPTPQAIVEHMLANDAFSQWLGIRVLEIGPGRCALEMLVKPEMTNGFGIAHGGIAYSLADSALAFAANNHGRQALSVKTAISHFEKIYPGDLLTAVATETNLSHKLGHYHISINKGDRQVAFFEGTVYRSSQIWNID